MEFTTSDRNYHEKSTVCYICNNNKAFFREADSKVRDHDHLTGR